MQEYSDLQAQETVLSILRAAPTPQGTPSLRSVQATITTCRMCVRQLNKEAKVEEPLAVLVGDSVTQSAYPVLLLLRKKDFENASRTIVEIWRTTLEAFLESTRSLLVPAGKPSKLENMAEELELLSAWNTAVSEVIRAEASRSEGRDMLRRLAVHLELSHEQLGTMFGVSRETIRRWETGANPIPVRHVAKLVSADRSLSSLLRMFRQTRLAQAIRRKADLFDGERALDWILRRRHRELVDRYENTFMYQVH